MSDAFIIAVQYLLRLLFVTLPRLVMSLCPAFMLTRRHHTPCYIDSHMPERRPQVAESTRRLLFWGIGDHAIKMQQSCLMADAFYAPPSPSCSSGAFSELFWDEQIQEA